MTNILYISEKIKYPLPILQHLYLQNHFDHFITKPNFYLSICCLIIDKFYIS
jgi:hypothetical protein